MGRSEKAEGRGTVSSCGKPQPPDFRPSPTVPCATTLPGVLFKSSLNKTGQEVDVTLPRTALCRELGTCFLKVLPCKHNSPSLIPRTHIRKDSMVV